MRSISVAALGLVCALTGCFAMSGRTGEAGTTAQAAWAHCDQLRQMGQLKTHVAAVDCAVRPVLAAYESADYTFMDLVYVAIQARRMGAIRVDNGDLSDEQYRRDVAALDARLAAEEKRRKDIQFYGGQTAPVPPEQLVAGLASFAPEARAAAPLPRAGGCVPLGAIRACK